MRQPRYQCPNCKTYHPFKWELCLPCSLSANRRDALALYALQFSPNPQYAPYSILEFCQRLPAGCLYLDVPDLENTIIKACAQVRSRAMPRDAEALKIPSRSLNTCESESQHRGMRDTFQLVKGLRTMLFHDQRGLCPYCGQPPSEAEPVEDWEVDVVLPVPFDHMGNSYVRWNFYQAARLANLLRLVHRSCNSWKARAEKGAASFLEHVARSESWKLSSVPMASKPLESVTHFPPWSFGGAEGRPKAEDISRMRESGLGMIATLFLHTCLRFVKYCKHDTKLMFMLYVENMRTVAVCCDECVQFWPASPHLVFVNNKSLQRKRALAYKKPAPEELAKEKPQPKGKHESRRQLQGPEQVRKLGQSRNDEQDASCGQSQ